jgi:ATP-dependent Lon protease
VRTGLKEVVLPEQNQSDWLELPEDVRQKIKATFVRKISDLLPNVFKNR